MGNEKAGSSFDYLRIFIVMKQNISSVPRFCITGLVVKESPRVNSLAVTGSPERLILKKLPFVFFVVNDSLPPIL